MFSKKHTIDNTPSVLTSADLLASDYNGLLGADNGEWDHALCSVSDLLYQADKQDIP
jgi:hypothetical protein